MSPRFKVAYVPWYRPVRLAAHRPDGTFEFVGWVWRQTAYLVNNLHYGWIAFIGDQFPEKLEICPSCKRPMHEPTKE